MDAHALAGPPTSTATALPEGSVVSRLPAPARRALGRWWRLPVPLRDAVLPALGTIPMLVAGLGAGAAQAGEESTALACALVIACWLSLALRRRWPVGVLAATCVLSVATAAIEGDPGFVDGGAAVPPIVVAVYTVASRTSWRLALAAWGGAYAALAVSAGLSSPAAGAAGFIAMGAVAAGAAALGLYVGTRRAYLAQLRERAARLEREQELLAAQAVADERVRIARELHDVVAHAVSLLVVQSGAVRETLPGDHPARPVLDSMAGTGRDALAELHRMLGLLRSTQGAAELAPQPGVERLAELVDGAGAAGVDATLRVEGEPRPLPTGVALSAYRIVQEALTNVRRHAGPARAQVVLRYGRDEVELRITDDGLGSGAAPSAAGGHGLVGMRERVALFGGELFAGAAPGGGWAVRAVLPTRERR